jgi:hypothetical protein
VGFWGGVLDGVVDVDGLGGFLSLDGTKRNDYTSTIIDTICLRNGLFPLQTSQGSPFEKREQ